MTRPWRYLAVLLCIVAVPAALFVTWLRRPVDLHYEIYELRDNSRNLLANGVLNGDELNVKSTEHSEFGQTFSDRSVALPAGFQIGVAIFPEKQLSGFGLWIKQNDRGFSWNWFTREKGRTYRKLQGDGHVKATIAVTNDAEQLTGVEFLDDIPLTGALGPLGALGGDTHAIVV